MSILPKRLGENEKTVDRVMVECMRIGIQNDVEDSGIVNIFMIEAIRNRKMRDE